MAKQPVILGWVSLALIFSGCMVRGPHADSASEKAAATVTGNGDTKIANIVYMAKAHSQTLCLNRCTLTDDNGKYETACVFSGSVNSDIANATLRNEFKGKESLVEEVLEASFAQGLSTTEFGSEDQHRPIMNRLISLMKPSNKEEECAINEYRGNLILDKLRVPTDPRNAYSARAVRLVNTTDKTIRVIAQLELHSNTRPSGGTVIIYLKPHEEQPIRCVEPRETYDCQVKNINVSARIEQKFSLFDQWRPQDFNLSESYSGNSYRTAQVQFVISGNKYEINVVP